MKKLFIALFLIVMLIAGIGSVGASETLPEEDTKVSVTDSSFTTLSSRPITMD